MATRTSVGTGNWNTAGTWDTGVPLDGDDVVIATGHVVTFDADQSGFTTGVKVTITGTLNHALTGGPYTLFIKTGASVVGAGVWNIGTLANPIPFAVKHTITGAADWRVDGTSGLTMTVFGAEPSIKYVKLSAAEALGQTELSVDTDVSADIWAAGDTIRINNINKALDSEERVIAAGGIAAGTITVTAGLTAAKLAGSYICLMTRNVKIIAVGTQHTINKIGFGGTVNKLTIGGGMFVGVPTKNILDTSPYANITGGTFSNANVALNNSANSTISGGVFSGNVIPLVTDTGVAISNGVFSGNTYALYSVISAVISGGIFTGNSSGLHTCTSATISGGTFSGSNSGLNNCTSATISGGTFSGSNSGLYNCTSATISGGTFTDNTYDLSRVDGRLYNILLTSTVEHYQYTLMAATITNCQSDDHDRVDGALKAWSKGGVVTSQATVKPDGYTKAYLYDLESNTYPAFWTKTFSVEVGNTVTVDLQLRKDASMTYLPRVYLMAGTGNPLAGTLPVDTFTMTNSIDTWETDVFTLENNTTTGQVYTLYFMAQNATGNAYSAHTIKVVSVDMAAALALLASIKAKTDVIPASPAAAGEYTAAIGAIPTAPLLASGYTAPDNAGIAAIKAKTDLIPASPAEAGEYTASIAAVKAETALIVEDTGTTLPATLTTIDNLVDDLETRLTATRAGYLDKLNVSGTLAHSNDAATYKADVSALATSTEVGAIALLGETVIGTYTVQDILTILAAKMVGKASGGGTTTIKYRGVDDTTDVVVETVDDYGNRSAVTLTV